MLRKTIQRDAIRKALVHAARPLTTQEILETAQEEVPQIGIATVYRTVKTLAEEGSIRTVVVPGEPDRYEVSGKAHHHHFSCRVCGRMFEMDGCPVGLENLVPKGFLMEDHEVFIYGRCDECN
ncbi:MAG: transcriptional repressor [Candidatus Hydrogenedentes bacterium]|nr:transcriptional repressor [Candidatus Hydrogenedentota bacterium]